MRGCFKKWRHGINNGGKKKEKGRKNDFQYQARGSLKGLGKQIYKRTKQLR